MVSHSDAAVMPIHLEEISPPRGAGAHSVVVQKNSAGCPKARSQKVQDNLFLVVFTAFSSGAEGGGKHLAISSASMVGEQGVIGSRKHL